MSGSWSSGAAGGVGTAGVQLAAAAGAQVTATVRDPLAPRRGGAPWAPMR